MREYGSRLRPLAFGDAAYCSSVSIPEAANSEKAIKHPFVGKGPRCRIGGQPSKTETTQSLPISTDLGLYTTAEVQIPTTASAFSFLRTVEQRRHR